MTDVRAWMPFYMADYFRDTRHLRAAEHGAYCLLLMTAWTRGGPLPADEDDLRAIACMTKREWKDSRETILAFFYRSENSFRHKRIDAELDHAKKISLVRTKVGKTRATKRWNFQKESEENQRSVDASAMPENMLENAPSPSPKEEAKPVLSLVPPREPKMPTLNDGANAWAHLADHIEVDDRKMIRRPMVSGTYLDVAGELVCEAANINAYRVPVDWRPLVAWLKAGLDLHADILPAVKRVAARPNYRPPKSLAYFDQVVGERRRAAS